MRNGRDLHLAQAREQSARRKKVAKAAASFTPPRIHLPIAASYSRLHGGHKGSKQSGSVLDRLHAALVTVAELVVTDPAYGPIFQRLEREVALEEQARTENLLDRARAIASQNEIGVRSVATWDKVPPAP